MFFSFNVCYFASYFIIFRKTFYFIYPLNVSITEASFPVSILKSGMSSAFSQGFYLFVCSRKNTTDAVTSTADGFFPHAAISLLFYFSVYVNCLFQVILSQPWGRQDLKISDVLILSFEMFSAYTYWTRDNG